MLDFKRPTKFFLMMASVFLMLWTLAFAISRCKDTYELFRYSYMPFHAQFYKISKLARSESGAKTSIVFVGLSSTREAIDEVELNRNVGATVQYVNLATGGFNGLAHSLEMISHLMVKNRASADYVLLGLQSYFLRAGQTSAMTSGLADLMNFTGEHDFINFEEESNRRDFRNRLICNSLNPLSIYTWQTGRLLRLAGFKLNNILQNEYNDEYLKQLSSFIPNAEFLYANQSYNKSEQEKRIAELFKNLEKNNYRPDLESKRSMIRTFDNLIAVSRRKFGIVLLPEHSMVRAKREIQPMKSALNEILVQYKDKISFTIDLTDAVPDNLFYDGGHVLTSGRDLTTKLIEERIKPYLSK